MSAPLKLTFGIELECIGRFDPSVYDTAIPMGEGILWPRGKLTKDPNEKSRRLYRRAILNAINAANSSLPQYSTFSGAWAVTTDDSIDLSTPAPSGLLDADIEIKSPAYRYSPQAVAAILAILHPLPETFDLRVHTSCALHVHVGNKCNGFPLQSLKNFCSLTTIFEPQLNSLHPPRRIASVYAKPSSSVFKGTNPRDTASLIQQYESLRDLVLRYARDGKWPDRFVAYNLCPLVFGEGRSQTVEFRSHEATFDGEGIARWIETACGVLSTAHEMEVGELLNLVRECALDRKFTVVDLLRRFRLMEQAEYYDARGLYLHLRPAWAWVDSAAEDAVPLGGEDGEEETVEGRTVVKVVAKTLPWVRKNAPVVMFWVVDRLGAESDAAKEKWEPPCVCGAQDDEKEVIEVPRVHRMREKEDDSKGDCVCGAQDDEEATRYFPRPQTMAAMKPFRVMDRIRRGTGASNMSLEEPAVCGAEDVGNESLGF